MSNYESVTIVIATREDEKQSREARRVQEDNQLALAMLSLFVLAIFFVPLVGWWIGCCLLGDLGGILGGCMGAGALAVLFE